MTDEGERLLDHAVPVSRNIDSALLRALPQGRRETFLDALQAIVKGLKGRRI